jgi:hypothetical protein
LQDKLAIIAVHHVHCRAGNEDPQWDDSYLYFLTKGMLEDLSTAVGDEKMEGFSEWWSYETEKQRTTSGRHSKKDCMGGKEILKNKHEAQLTKSVGSAVSSHLFNCNTNC